MNCRGQFPTPRARGAVKTYLCGGISGLGDAECRDWREVAKSLLNTETLDPMRRDYRGKEDESVTEIVEGDLEDIAEAQFLLVNATRASWGTAMEICYAAMRMKVIVAFAGDVRVSPWLRYHCTIITRTIEEAVDYINTQSASAEERSGTEESAAKARALDDAVEYLTGRIDDEKLLKVYMILTR